MRCLVLVLLMFLFVMNINCTATAGRIDQVRPGMTRTDVAIQLGSPMDVKVSNEAVIWTYPGSDSQVCMIKFVNTKVSQEPIKCNKSDPTGDFGVKSAPYLRAMNSDMEYQGRLKRYCGMKPEPLPGCRIAEACVNGGWEQICTPEINSSATP